MSCHTVLIVGPHLVAVSIDRESPVPLYHQLAEQLSAAISDGTLQPGDPFENEVALAQRLGLSRPTVRRAIQEMVDQGLLVRRRGLGTRVANRKVHRRAELTSLFDDLRRAGRTPQTRVGLLSWNAVSAGGSHAAGITSSGQLYSWGSNESGPGTNPTWSPQLRGSSTDWIAVGNTFTPRTISTSSVRPRQRTLGVVRPQTQGWVNTTAWSRLRKRTIGAAWRRSAV